MKETLKEKIERRLTELEKDELRFIGDMDVYMKNGSLDSAHRASHAIDITKALIKELEELKS